MAYAHINIAYQFAGSIIPVGRHSIAEARITVWISYLDMLEMMGLQQDIDYTLRQGSMELSINFANKSQIIFVPMDKSKDREWRRIRGINATACGVDEVDSVDEEGYDTLYSRAGRRNINGAPAVTISTCNPNDAWVKRKIYDPWRNMQRPPEARDPNIGELEPTKIVIEFEMQDSFLYHSGYYKRFMTRAKAWVERFLFNNWDYLDDDKSLFKMRALDSIMVNRIERGTRFLGVDPAAEGTDRRVISLWQGDTLVDIWVYTKEDLERLAEPHEAHNPPYGDILARETIRIAEEESVGSDHIGGDVVGNGRAWYEAMLRYGWEVREFKAGAKPMELFDDDGEPVGQDYDMLRSQMMHLLAMAAERAKVHIYTGCNHVSTAKKELLLHRADQSAKILKVETKQLLKHRLGESPDIADSIMVGYWVKMLANSAVVDDTPVALGRSAEEQYRQSGF